jgi:Tfp pilus assembly protein PilO
VTKYLISWPNSYKILLFTGVCLLFITIHSIILFKKYGELQNLQHQKILLNQQLLQKQAQAVKFNQIISRVLTLEHTFHPRLRELRQSLTPSMLYTQIALLIKSHHLKILRLTPQSTQFIFGLEKYNLEIDISGAESNIIDFLQLLMHQSWIVEISQLEFTTFNPGIQIHISMAVYHAKI